MPQLTAEGQRIVEEIASRHGFSAEAVLTLLTALAAGHGTQAQFSHSELGGLGQWSRGGMIMIGDMFNNALKARVDALCTELSGLLDRTEPFTAPRQLQSQSQGGVGGGAGVSLFVPGGSTAWWPADLGTPASVGAQNDLRYAYFPATRRLAIDLGGRLSVHDTGQHQISGVSQQQGSDQSVTFTSQLGLVRIADLPRVSAGESLAADRGIERETRRLDGSDASVREHASSPPAPSGAAPEDDIFAKIERLAALRRKDILTDEEYAVKKAELLARL